MNKRSRARMGVSELMGAILLIAIVLTVGAVYVLSSTTTLSNVSSAIGGQMDQAIIRTKQLLELEFYVKNATSTSVWIFSYELAAINIDHITTPSGYYTLSNATLSNATDGQTVSQILPGQLYKLTLPENTTEVEIVSTVGGVWRWQTP
jgi:flagellin-like protein